MQTNTTEFQQASMVEVSQHQAGQRLDNFLMAQFRELPKGRIYQMIRKGEVRINKGRAKPTTRLEAGDLVRLPPIKIATKIEVEIPESAWRALKPTIIFENDDFLVIDKPSGLAVHKGSQVPFGIIEILKAFGGNDFYELVQRLDRATSGLLLIAKTGQALRQLQEHKLARTYELLVAGNWADRFTEKTTIITDPLDTENRQNGERHVIVSESGKPAETHFTCLDATNRISHLQADLQTGRTHQIRVHSAHHGFPLLGDSRYNPHFNLENIAHQRLALHAVRLCFDLDGKAYEFNSPFPIELHKLLVKP